MKFQIPSYGKFVIVISLLFLVLESALRAVWSENFRLRIEEKNTAFDYHPDLGWFPRPSAEGPLMGHRKYYVRHNNLGFRDGQVDSKTLPRILVLGDSFVYGYDVEEGERFTDYLSDSMKGWEVLNCGVTGYGSVQELMLLHRYFDMLQPDVVFQLFEYGTDAINNASNIHIGGYYRPFYEVENNQLILKGTPVPKGLPYFQNEFPILFRSYLVRAMFMLYLDFKHPKIEIMKPPTNLILEATRNFVQDKGAEYYLGFTQIGINGNENKFCHDQSLDCIELRSDKVYPNFGKHWTPKGHREVASKLINFLKAKGVSPTVDSLGS